MRRPLSAPPSAAGRQPAPARPLAPEAATRQIDNWLAANRLKEVRAPGGGNRPYHGLIKVAGDHLSRIFARQDLSPLTLRRYVANVLRHDQSLEERGEPARYGELIRQSRGQSRAEAWQDHITWIGTDYSYREDAAEVVPNVLAFEFGLPLTLVQPGPERPLVTDVGPPGERRYVLILRDGNYVATEPLPGQPAPEPTTARKVQVLQEITRLRSETTRLRKQFTWLQDRYAALSGIAPPADTEEEARERAEAEGRTEDYGRIFHQILGQQRPDFSRQAPLDFERQRLQRLRHWHRLWLSAVRGAFSDFAPSEDAADFTIDELRDYQRDHLPLSADLPGSEQATDADRSSTPATSSDESSGDDEPPPGAPALVLPSATPSEPQPAAPFRDKTFAPTVPGRASVHHIEGDLLRLPKPVGAIVNPAADNLILGGSGLSREIQSRGGDRITDEIRVKLEGFGIEGVPTGDAVATSAPNIKAEYVIHVVPPDFESVEASSATRELLAKTYRNALALADDLKLTSVAFPVLSGGRLSGLTPEEAEQIGLRALRGANTKVRDVYLLRYRDFARITLPDAESPLTPPAPSASLLRPQPRRGTVPVSAEERAILAANPFLAGAPDLVFQVQMANLAARRRQAAERLDREDSYRNRRETIAKDPDRQLDVDPDGDCFFNSLLLMDGEHLRTMGPLFGWGDREPTVLQMRDTIASALERSYQAYWEHPTQEAAQTVGLYAALFPGLTGEDALEESERDALVADYAAWIRVLGRWTRNIGRDVNLGDNLVNIAADLWQVPLTSLGTDRPTDFGPASGVVDRGYLLYDGTHYMGLAAVRHEPAVPAAQWLTVPDRPEFVIPEGIDWGELTGEFAAGFAELRAEVAGFVEAAAPADPEGLLANRLALLDAGFAGAVDDAGRSQGREAIWKPRVFSPTRSVG